MGRETTEAGQTKLWDRKLLGAVSTGTYQSGLSFLAWGFRKFVLVEVLCFIFAKLV